MKILHVVYECTPGRFRGGVQKVVWELANAQSMLTDNVEIWTIGPKEEEVKFGALTLRSFLGRARFSSKDLRNTLNRRWREFDVIHAHNTFLPLNRYVAALGKRGAKVFYNPHGALDDVLLRGSSIKAWKKRIYNFLFERPNLNRSTGVVCLNEWEGRQLQRFGVQVPIYCIGNGISSKNEHVTEADIQSFRKKHNVGLDVPIVLFVGRLVEKKCVDYIIKAMREVKKDVPSAILIIAGDRRANLGYVAFLDALISKLDLIDSVRWAGFLNEDEKPAVMATTQVFVHASRSEGMAMSILEAMQYGLPTVVTKGCYMDKAAAEGALCEVDQDPSKIGAAIVNLIQDRSLAKCMSRNAVGYISQHHDWKEIASRYLAMYRGAGDVFE